MYKIVIQNEDSSTVIHNIHEDELPFWEQLLSDAPIRGQVNIIPTQADRLTQTLDTDTAEQSNQAA